MAVYHTGSSFFWNVPIGGRVSLKYYEGLLILTNVVIGAPCLRAERSHSLLDRQFIVSELFCLIKQSPGNMVYVV